jgi:hypothetical protein
MNMVKTRDNTKGRKPIFFAVRYDQGPPPPLRARGKVLDAWVKRLLERERGRLRLLSLTGEGGGRAQKWRQLKNVGFFLYFAFL